MVTTVVRPVPPPPPPLQPPPRTPFESGGGGAEEAARTAAVVVVAVAAAVEGGADRGGGGAGGGEDVEVPDTELVLALVDKGICKERGRSHLRGCVKSESNSVRAVTLKSHPSHCPFHIGRLRLLL